MAADTNPRGLWHCGAAAALRVEAAGVARPILPVRGGSQARLRGEPQLSRQFANSLSYFCGKTIDAFLDQRQRVEGRVLD